MDYIKRLRELVGNEPLILVGSIVIILNKDGHILLQQRTEPAGKWGLPGGLMELGESPEETATREVFEETGLEVKNLSLMNVYSGKDYFIKLPNGDIFQSVTVAYYTHEYAGNLVNNQQEGLDLQFFDVNHLPEYMVGSHWRMIQAYKKLL